MGCYYNIEGTEFVSAQSLLSKATNVTHKLTSVKNSIIKISRILKGFDIPVEETLAEINNLKQALNVAAGADNVKTDKQKIFDIPEEILIEPDIYVDSGHSSSQQMEAPEVIDITDTNSDDTETIEVSTDKWGWCIVKEPKSAKGRQDSMVFSH